MAPARGAWLKARARSNSKIQIQAGERRGRCIGPEEEIKDPGQEENDESARHLR